MTFHFLLPSTPLQPREADDIFQEQAEVFRKLGFGVSLFSLEDLQSGAFKLRGAIPAGATVVYRGWMLTASEYQKLADGIRAQGGKPLNSLEAYLACHHLPNWYPLVKEFTAETVVFPVDDKLPAALTSLGWDKVFLKDYVKSLKTAGGSAISKPEEVRTFIAEMEKFRGAIEGGVCARRFESFRRDSETRYFVVNGKAHAPAGEVPSIVNEIAPRIPSPFFAVDVAIREDGVPRIVELGDGQVSDLVGWQADDFGKLWLPQEFIFDYGQEVDVAAIAPKEFRPGTSASVCGMIRLDGQNQYVVEFADGDAVEIPERFLSLSPE